MPPGLRMTADPSAARDQTAYVCRDRLQLRRGVLQLHVELRRAGESARELLRREAQRARRRLVEAIAGRPSAERRLSKRGNGLVQERRHSGFVCAILRLRVERRRARLRKPRLDEQHPADLVGQHSEETLWPAVVPVDRAFAGADPPAGKEPLQPRESLRRVAPADRLEKGVDVLGRLVQDLLADGRRKNLPPRSGPVEQLVELRGENSRLGVGPDEQAVDRLRLDSHVILLRAREREAAEGGADLVALLADRRVEEEALPGDFGEEIRAFRRSRRGQKRDETIVLSFDQETQRGLERRAAAAFFLRKLA